MTNQTSATDQDDQNVVEFGDSPGRRLRVQRQSRGLAVERIASQLHLRPETIEALEQDRFDRLPDPVFVTGYLRNYARLLALDPTPLIAAYQAQADIADVAARPIERAETGRVGQRLLVRLVSLALAGAAVGIVLLWWDDRGADEVEQVMGDGGAAAPALAADPMGEGTGRDALPSAPPSVAQQTAEGAPRARADDAAEPASPPAAPAILRLPEAGPAALPEPDPPLDPLPPEPTAPAAMEGAPMLSEAEATPSDEPGPAAEIGTAVEGASTSERQGILLEFSGPSWVEVQDAEGMRLIFGEMQAGERREVMGRAPFRFTIGRVSNTRVTVAGRPFDLLGHSRGNVARFTLHPDSIE